MYGRSLLAESPAAGRDLPRPPSSTRLARAGTSTPRECWGAQLSGTGACEPVRPKSGAFREHFCAKCRAGPVVVPASRIRFVDPALSVSATNSHAEGVWNENGSSRVPFWPPFRVVNQTSDSKDGLKLVVLKHETRAPLHGLLPLPAHYGCEVAFLVRRTLQTIPVGESLRRLDGLGALPHLSSSAVALARVVSREPPEPGPAGRRNPTLSTNLVLAPAAPSCAPAHAPA